MHIYAVLNDSSVNQFILTDICFFGDWLFWKASRRLLFQGWIRSVQVNYFYSNGTVRKVSPLNFRLVSLWGVVTSLGFSLVQQLLLLRRHWRSKVMAPTQASQLNGPMQREQNGCVSLSTTFSSLVRPPQCQSGGAWLPIPSSTYSRVPLIVWRFVLQLGLTRLKDPMSLLIHVSMR